METKANKTITTRAGIGLNPRNQPFWLQCGPKGPCPQVQKPRGSCHSSSTCPNSSPSPSTLESELFSRRACYTVAVSAAAGRGTALLRLTWLGVPAGGLASSSEPSLLSDSSTSAALPGAVSGPPRSWGVTFPNLVGPGAVLAGGSLAGAGHTLAWAGFAEGVT